MQCDAVTRMATRGQFDVDLPNHIHEAVAAKYPLALIMGDVDHFKRVNDTRGHPCGDAVLREVSARIESVTRHKGVAYRYGGEEIVVLLRNHSLDEGVAVAERARRRIEAEAIENLTITMSFGVACFPEHGIDALGIINAADRAMYDAKNRGRNFVRFFGERETLVEVPANARQPERKVAPLGRFTEDQKILLRKTLLRGEGIQCPDDGAWFECEDVTTIGSLGRDLLIVCPDCGLTEELRGPQRA